MARFVGRAARCRPTGYVGSLMDYKARAYSPARGRFVSADTVAPKIGSIGLDPSLPNYDNLRLLLTDKLVAAMKELAILSK